MIEAKFLTELETRQLNDKEVVLLAPLRYQSAILGGIVEVEKGFVSDGSSVPRVPFAYWFYGGRAHHEGVLHDRFYRSPNHEIRVLYPDGSNLSTFIPKNVADTVFAEAMCVREKGIFLRGPMYWGVKFGGMSSYITGPKRFRIIPI